MRRNDFVDFAKGVLITLVCVGHSIQFLSYRNVGFWGDPFFKMIYVFHMPLFMGLSGYVARRGILNATRTPAEAMRYLGARTLSLLLPVFSWVIVLQGAGTVVSRSRTWAEFPAAVAFQASISFWFLWALLVSVCLMVAAELAGRFRPPALALLSVGLMALPDWDNLHLIKYVFPYFVLGYFLAGFDLNIGPETRRRSWATTIALGLAALACYAMWDDRTYIYISRMSFATANLRNVGVRWLAGLVVSAFALRVLSKLYPRIPRSVRGGLSTLGKDSIFVYLLQTFAFLWIAKLRIGWSGGGPPVAAPLVAVAAGCLVTAACWYAGHLLCGHGAVARVFFGRGTRPADATVPRWPVAVDSV